MNKQGKEVSGALVWTIAILLVAVVGMGAYSLFWMPHAQSAITGNAVLTPAEQNAAANSCGSSKQTAVSITLKNSLNTTAAETDDANYVIYQILSDGTETQVASGSDMTAGAQTLDCGQKFRLKVLGGGNMNSRLTGVYTQNAAIDTDGSVLFTTTAPTLTLGVAGSKHATIVVRAYDSNAKARVYNNIPASDPQAFKASGVVFTSSADNATATSVTAGSSLMMDIELKSADIAADGNDYGTLVGFAAANTYWDSMTSVTYDNVALVDIKNTLPSTLTPEEVRKYSTDQFVYLIPQGKLMDRATHTLHIEALKSSGATGTNSLVVDITPRANFLSVDGYTVKTGAAKDSSTFPFVDASFGLTFETQG